MARGHGGDGAPDATAVRRRPSGVRASGGRLRYELRLTWHGGARILERVERSDFDVLHRPTLGARDAGTILWRAALWTAA